MSASPRRRLVITSARAYTIPQTAALLGYGSRRQVYDLMDSGELAWCRLGGGAKRIPEDAIREYLQAAVDRDMGIDAAASSQRVGARRTGRR